MQNSLIEIKTRRNLINWPVGYNYTQQELKDYIGLSVYNRRGEDLTDRARIDLEQVNRQQPGKYPGRVLVVDLDGQTATKSLEVDVIAQQATNLNQTANQHNKRKKRRIVLGVLLLMIIALMVGLFACHNQKAQEATNAAESSSINNNSSDISSLKDDNDKLKHQVNALKEAVGQYQQDHDRDALQDRLSNLQDENQQLANQLKGTDLAQLKAIDKAVNAINSNPARANQALSQLDDINTANNLWGQFQDWLSQHV